ncbi:hypothetical protein HRbin30_00329 [bacterium HR30]|nr:hypothetical protein HRbin30_00329 [bacterium HR30]
MPKFALFLTTVAMVAVLTPAPSEALSPQAQAARLCRAKLTSKGKAYAKTRRNLILACTNKLLKCALLEEIHQQDVKSCRDTATAFCVAKLITPGQGLMKARDKFVNDVVAACTPLGIAQMCSSGPGGLNFNNHGACGSANPSGCGGTNLQDLATCLRGVIDFEVELEVSRVAPRAGVLLDNTQSVGIYFSALQRPSSTTVVLSPASPGVLNNPGTINLPSTDRLAIDATALACGSNSSNGKVEVRVGTGTSCNDLIPVQTVVSQESYFPPVYLGPFEQDLQYCITWKDPGSGGCTTGQGSSAFGTIDVTPDGSSPPPLPASTVLACHKRFQGSGKGLAALAANKLHACGDKVAKCELANEIDGAGTCTPSYTTPCSTIDSAIDNKLNTGQSKITQPLTPCTLLTFQQLRSFVGGLGFRNPFAGCASAPDLNALANCALTDVRCFVEMSSGTRDPRLKQWLTTAGLNPTADFPCVP